MSRLVTGVAEEQSKNGTQGSPYSRMAREFLASGTAVATANITLNPVEVIKTRMQLNGAAAAAAAVQSSHVNSSGPAAAGAAAAPASAAGRPLLAHTASVRFFSRSAANREVAGVSRVPAAAPTAAQSLLSAPTPPAGAVASAAVGSTRAAVAAAASPAAALEASLQAATAAISQSSSITSRQLPVGLSSSCQAVQRPGFLATAGLILREEGPSGFTRGIQASATRAVLNGGIRLGLYDPIKTLLSVDGTGRDLHMGQKLAAGSISGCIGAVLTTPIELAKTRLQAPSATTRSMSAVLQGVIREQGVAGLWRGATPSVLRLILLNSSMVATYDEVKGRIRALTGWSNGLHVVLSSSMVAGLVTTTVINPADVARAYMQTGRGSSLLGVARSILAREGPRGFLKGWTAAYARTGPQTLIIFTVSETVRPLFGLSVIGGSG